VLSRDDAAHGASAILSLRRWGSPLTALGLITPTEVPTRLSVGGLHRELSLDRCGSSGRSERSVLPQRIGRAEFCSTFPYSTLLINVSGSLVLGFFLFYSTERVLLDPRWRLLIAIGFCGSYTTFSSYAFESFALMEQGRWFLMGLNVLASNALCFAAVLAGAALARGL
jgi:CrcB protein